MRSFQVFDSKQRRVAQGSEFTSGRVAVEWFKPGYMGVYPSLESFKDAAGKVDAYVTFDDDPTRLVEIPIPHLRLGAEGADAEFIAITNNIGPVLPGSREAYDRIRKIWAPLGWTASAGFTLQGHVCLSLYSPSMFLYAEEPKTFGGDNKLYHTVHYRRAEASFQIGAKGIEILTPYGEPQNISVFVDDMPGAVKSYQYSTWGLLA